MSRLKSRTHEAIGEVLAFVQKSPWNAPYTAQLECLAKQLEEPCVLAVAGRVKAGKSTLINALLGQDLAQVGTTETTATINYFRYGWPENENKPVRCVWCDDRVTWESKAFLDSLQGNDAETLARAEGIRHLEFLVPHDYLRAVTLVDTPGTDALVEDHQQATDDFFRLRQRHSTESRQIADTADAVLYLIGQVAHATNLAFLDECGTMRAFNALGVLGQADIQDEILEQRHALAARAADQLSGHLNTVVPVSAALCLALQRHSPEELAVWQEELRQIPEPRFQRMLGTDRAFLREYPDCPIPTERRRELLSGTSWRVFVVLARELYRRPLAEAITELELLAGFTDLRQLLRDHFFERGQLLRCHRVLDDVYRLLKSIERKALRHLQRQETSNAEKRHAFLQFINSHPESTRPVAAELRAFLETQLPSRTADHLESELTRLLLHVEEAQQELAEVNESFHGLRLLDAAPDEFSAAESTELRHLFGQSGIPSDAELDSEKAKERQLAWHLIHGNSRLGTIRRQIAELAVRLYSRTLDRLHGA
jgi:hypothetical protein